MVTTSWFITAVEARNNILKDIAVHSEITGIEREILQAVQRGDYEVSVTDNTLMTESSPDPVLPFTVNPSTDTLTVSAHSFRTGDAVTVSSTGELPPPLIQTRYYYVIYIDLNSIKLASSRANALAGQPISIDFSQGVATVALGVVGSGYLSEPRVGFVGGDATLPATARAVLQRYGIAASVTLLTPGAGYTSVPSVSFSTVGNGAVLGPCSFKTVGVALLFGGSGYNLNDLIYIIGGVGTSTVLRVTGVDGGAVTTVSVIEAGNYTTLPTLSGAITSSSGVGSGASFVLSMGIASISITSGGASYINPPLISITSGGGSGATATANISGGQIATVVVTSPGLGFTGQPTISVTAGSGATGTARLIPTTVGSITLTNNGGSTYTDVPTVNINSVGSGATPLAVVMRAVSATVVSVGTGYSQGDQLLVTGGVGSYSTQIEVLTVDNLGHILTYSIVNPGAYTVLPPLFSNNTVGGTGVGASWNLSMGVDSVTLLSGGSGYTTSPLLLFSAPVGSGAEGYAKISGGVVTELVITSYGSGYTSIPVPTISGGSGATATAQLVPTTVNTITVDNPGSGYLSPPAVSIIGGGGQGATAAATLTGDSIDTIVVVTPGSGYTSPPSVVIEGNATATANLTPTQLQSITVSDGGTGYTHVPNVVISGAATAVAVLNITGLLSIDITTGGSNYVTDPTVVLTNGAGQVGIPVAPITKVNRSFSLDQILVTDSGSGYSSTPAVTISAPEISTGVQATSTATLGSGTGSFSITPYQPSNDYFKVWKNQSPSNELVVRPMNDQMNAVIKYFTDLGYTINRYTNPNTGDTLAWSVKW